MRGYYLEITRAQPSFSWCRMHNRNSLFLLIHSALNIEFYRTIASLFHQIFATWQPVTGEINWRLKWHTHLYAQLFNRRKLTRVSALWKSTKKANTKGKCINLNLGLDPIIQRVLQPRILASLGISYTLWVEKIEVNPPSSRHTSFITFIGVINHSTRLTLRNALQKEVQWPTYWSVIWINHSCLCIQHMGLLGNVTGLI